MKTPTLAALWCIPVSLILALIVGPMLRDGMFIDGLAYTNIAKNLHYGIGDFWAPVVDEGGPIFYGHPPLLFYLESLFFDLLGDHTYTEDVYNFTVFTLTVFVLYRIWILIVGSGYRAYFFCPLLLLVLNQEVQLRYPNTMLECGMTLVLLLFTYLFLALRDRATLLATALTGLGAFAAFWCKGPPGLFLLALPLLYALAVDRRWNWGALLIPLLTLSICSALLYLLRPESLRFLSNYLDLQVMASVRGAYGENLASNRFSFLGKLLISNLPGLAVVGLLLAIRHIGPDPDGRRKKLGLFFLLVGASAILPLVVSLKQASYYQIPSLPYFFIGLGLLLLPRLERLVAYVNSHRAVRRILIGTGTAGIVGCGIFAVSMLGTTDRRDVLPLAQAAEIGEVMKREGYDRYRFVVLGMDRPSESAMSYTVTGFLNRWHGIYRDFNEEATVVLYLLRDGGDFPIGDSGRLLYADAQIRVVSY